MPSKLSQTHHEIILFNKPFKVLCQFSPSGEKLTLADFIEQPGFYPAGRLDYDSEGLLLLTDNGQLQHQLTDPRHKLPKTYWVQVEGEITPAALLQLQTGVTLKDGVTRPAKAVSMPEPDALWPRDPPIRFRANLPTSWIALTITEGKNRQVRRMTAAVGYPTLRLIRYQIGSWSLANLAPGEFRREKLPDQLFSNGHQQRKSNTRQRRSHQRSKAR